MLVTAGVVWLLGAVVLGVVCGLTDRLKWWLQSAAMLPLVLGMVIWVWIPFQAVIGGTVILASALIIRVADTLVRPLAWRHHPALVGLGYWARVRFISFQNGRAILRAHLLANGLNVSKLS